MSAVINLLKSALNKIGYDMRAKNDFVSGFHSPHYIRHNARRLEHLASLELPLSGCSVLEVGAGIGDHTHFFLDRGCDVTTSEAREENLYHLKKRYPDLNVFHLDLENPFQLSIPSFDIVHCYGTLYHVETPKEVLNYLGKYTGKLLLLETCVSFGDSDDLNLIPEKPTNPTQSFSGMGCRPTRAWIYGQLKEIFEYVYIPLTQPNHEEFPLDWLDESKHIDELQRAVFIGSHIKLENPLLSPSLVDVQTRHN